MTQKPVDVAVGVLIKPNGDLLLGQRPAGKPYEGYWEFPGGKVDPGETILEALKREFVEELGLTIHSAEEWCGVEYVYPHAHVRLHFFISRDWSHAGTRIAKTLATPDTVHPSHEDGDEQGEKKPASPISYDY